MIKVKCADTGGNTQNLQKPQKYDELLKNGTFPESANNTMMKSEQYHNKEVGRENRGEDI